MSDLPRKRIHFIDLGPDRSKDDAEIDRLRARVAELEAALRVVNDYACYATEEDSDARLQALQEIGKRVRAALEPKP